MLGVWVCRLQVFGLGVPDDEAEDVQIHTIMFPTIQV